MSIVSLEVGPPSCLMQVLLGGKTCNVTVILTFTTTQHTKHSRLLGESSLSKVATVSGNQIPTVSAGEDKAIPKGTAYYLTATANDPDGDALTYCWEQLDSGRVLASDFGPNQLSGSMNRSLLPVGSNRRNIPNLTLVLANQLTEINPYLGSAWETVSNVGRNLRWGITVRDRDLNNPNGVGFAAQDEVVLEVVESAGPFELTTQAQAQPSGKRGKWNHPLECSQYAFGPYQYQSGQCFAFYRWWTKFPDYPCGKYTQ